MIKPKVLVFSGYGLNCEEETKYAFEKAGGLADIVHINDIIDRSKVLNDYQIFAMPGGFSYGDDTGSGNAFAQKIKNHLAEEFAKFLEKDILGIGMCNGFQILANLGVFGQIALLPNESARYVTRWVDLEVEGKTPWLAGIDSLSLPIAHGEGRFYIPEHPRQPTRLTVDWQMALKYVRGEICELENLPGNPNGSMDDIAGVTDKTGRILGLMPHPERAVSATQLPHWFAPKKTSPEGPGLQIFKNAVNYFL